MHSPIRVMKQLLQSVAAAVEILVHVLLGPVLHRFRTRWGTTPVERALRLPGDEVVENPAWHYDHAITIAAPRSAVWPWLLQLGQGRGGFYSYELLENAIGCKMQNVLEIHPELQKLRVGDRVRMHADGFGPDVVSMEPERSLVLGGPPNAKGSQATWSFYLLDGADGTTRLLERGRGVAGPGLVEKLEFGPYLMDPVGFVMSKKMLRTIKHLAEHFAATTPFPLRSSDDRARFVY
jgi:hypothetical protein